jgi:hypothetical protein
LRESFRADELRLKVMQYLAWTRTASGLLYRLGVLRNALDANGIDGVYSVAPPAF